MNQLFNEQGELLPDRLYTDGEVAEILGYSAKSNCIAQRRSANKALPRWIKFGKAVRTPGREIKKFIKENLIERNI